MHKFEEEGTKRKVEKDCAVTLKNGVTTTTFIIEERDDGDQARGEISTNSYYAMLLSGKELGDKISLAGDEWSWCEIISIETKYQHALSESLRLITTVFSGNSSMRMHSVEQTGDLNNGLGELLKLVDAAENRDRKIDKHLEGLEVPIAVQAMVRGVNLIRMWSQLIIPEGSGIKNVTTYEELAIALNCLKSGSGILLDVTALCSINHIQALEELALLENRKYVAQSTIYVFRQLVLELQPSSLTGSVSIAKYKGKYFKNVDSAEQVQAQIRHLEAIINWIESNCTILPCTAALKINAHKKAELDKVFGESTIDSIFTAGEKRCLLYSEDAVLRELAAQESDIAGVAGFMVVIYLQQQGKITRERYAQLMVNLSSLNYINLPSDLLSFQEAIKRTNFKFAWPLTRVVEGIISPIINDTFALDLVCYYLITIFKTPVTFILDQDICSLREQLAIRLLEVLEKRFDLNKSLHNIYLRMGEVTHPDDPDFEKIKRIVSRYLMI